VFCALALVGASRADTVELQKKAGRFERAGQWAEACRCYEELARRDRINAHIYREAYHRAYRRLQLTIRHTDPIYQAELKKLSVPQALDLYEQVLSVLTAAHPDRASLTTLHNNGLQELRNALEDEGFRARYFPDVKPDALAAFKAKLDAWPLTRVASRDEASRRRWPSAAPRHMPASRCGRGPCRP